MVVVTESGLYDLVFASRKPQARAFRRWVTNEVLPSIRKTGRYDGTVENAASHTSQGGVVNVTLPELGSFIVTTRPGEGAHIHQTEYTALT